MRHAMTAAAGLALFFGTACGSSSGGTTGTTGGPGTTGGSGTTTGGTATTSGSVNGGSSTGKKGLPDGTACSANDLCQSGVCGLNGSGNCCSATCKTDDALCAATACDTKGACEYPPGGMACNSSCQYGLFTGSVCDGNGACSAQKPVQCPMNLACNSAGTACAGTCDPANGAADCSLGWYCASSPAGGVCTPQISLGPCAANAECMSNVCGVSGTGHCCTQTACTNTAVPCGTSDCDAFTGECTFGTPTTSCDTGPISCLADNQTQVNPNTFCDGVGDCVPPIMTNCSPYACEAGNGDGGCRSDCSVLADCAKDFYCLNSVCVPQSAIGACTENDACISLQCGANGTGNCCFNFCGQSDPSCGITACDPTDGACIYPSGPSAPCGSILESCAGITQQNPSICDGMGNCPAPGTTDCAPFACGATACNTTCTKSTECAPGDVCDTSAKVCCPTLQNGGVLNVDNQNGSDSAACCGAVGYTECATIGMAMSIIDSAQATNVTINAYINGLGNGGDWNFTTSGESIPITLGWGVELVAPTVNFAPNWFSGYNGYTFQAYPEIFDITQYSANDTLAYASIVGSVADGPVQIGASQADNVYDSINNAAIQVENGAHLYIANANVFSNWYNYFYLQYDGYYSSFSPEEGAAFVVAPGGYLTLAQDQSGSNTGTVTVGVVGTSSNEEQQYWGWTGIACQSDYVSLGCTIDDATLPAGMSSLIMASMVKQDIDAEDFANITLKSAPNFGVTPSATGFRMCPYKGEGYEVSGTPAILLNGNVTMSLTNAIVQCVEGDAIHMNTSSHGLGNPTLTLTGATIQNTERALYASAGTATVSGSTFWYNYNNVKVDTDGTNSATVNLNGGATAGNQIVCTSAEESYQYSSGETPSTNVLNTTVNIVDASNVVWDTAAPDEFSCDSALTSCTCEIAAGCANAGGVDDMDAVYTGSGTITTVGNTLTAADCTPPKLCNGQVCTSGDTCCNFIYDYCSNYYECYPSEYCSGGFYEGYDSCDY